MTQTTPGQDLRSPLERPDWRYVEGATLDDIRGEDWPVLDRQRKQWMEGRQARDVLALLESQRDQAGFAYGLNNYRHCLQSATLALRAGEDDEMIAIAVLHDVGYTVAAVNHGEFAAALLRPFISEDRHWMLMHHQIFQSYHCHDHPRLDPQARERYRGHPAFALTAEFIARYDQNAIDPQGEILPIAAFAPSVFRLFAKPPRL